MTTHVRHETPGAVVRTAGMADAGSIAEIYTESILARDSTMDTEPVTESDVRGWLSRQSTRETILVCELDDVTVGWGIVKKYSDRPGYATTCETSVYLRRSRTGRGLGRLIQTRLMDFCRRSAYHHVVAKIQADNEVSLALHRRFGFTLVGVQREVGWMGGRWRDVAILQCLLESGSEGQGSPIS